MPKLKPAVEAQIRARQNSNGKFVAEWKHLKTWIYNRCWEDETPILELNGHKPILTDYVITADEFYGRNEH